jgi:hypothetical protein
MLDHWHRLRLRRVGNDPVEANGAIGADRIATSACACEETQLRRFDTTVRKANTSSAMCNSSLQVWPAIRNDSDLTIC